MTLGVIELQLLHLAHMLQLCGPLWNGKAEYSDVLGCLHLLGQAHSSLTKVSKGFKWAQAWLEILEVQAGFLSHVTSGG